MLSLKERSERDADLLLWALPPEEQTFLLALLDGQSQTDAYLAGHPRVERAAARSCGSRLASRANIVAAYDELLRLAGEEAIRILRSAAPKAAAVLVAELQGDDRKSAALAILDRIGAGPRMGLDVSQSRINGLDEFLDAVRADTVGKGA